MFIKICLTPQNPHRIIPPTTMPHNGNPSQSMHKHFSGPIAITKGIHGFLTRQVLLNQMYAFRVRRPITNRSQPSP